MRTPRRLAGCLGGLAAAALAAALLGEALLRVSGWRPKGDLVVVDARLGRRLVAGRDVEAWGARVVIDGEGLRVAPGARPPAPPGLPRVLFLGGSCTFGYGLEWADTYPAQLARRLAARGTPIEVINAGVPLGDSSNRRAFLLERGEALRPDLIVFSEAVNDLGGMEASQHHCFRSGSLELHVVWPAEERWPLVSAPPAEPELRGPALAAWGRSQLAGAGWWWFAQTLPRLRSAARASGAFAWLYRRDPARYQRDLAVDPARAAHGFALYQDNLAGMAAWAAEHRVPIVFLEQPRRGQQDFFELLPAAARAATAAALAELRAGRPARAAELLAPVVAGDGRYLTPRYDLAVAWLAAGRAAEAEPHGARLRQVKTFAHNYLMAESGRRLGVPVAHAELYFQDRRADDLFLGDGMHPSARGNAVMAESLERTLLAAGWPAPAALLPPPPAGP